MSCFRVVPERSAPCSLPTTSFSRKLVLLLLLAATLTFPGVAATKPAATQNAKDSLKAYWQRHQTNRKVMAAVGDTVDFLTTTGEILAKAVPDECFNGIGAPYGSVPCTTGVPKVNQAYVWGMTKAGNSVWFGTMANTHCLVLSLFHQFLEPHQTPSWVCEFGESQLVTNPTPPAPALPAGFGVFRPPKIYLYDTVAKTLVDKSPTSPADAARLKQTLGIRAAGTHGGVVLLGGPSLTGGLNLFAFRASDGAFLGSTNLAGYNNIRRFEVAQGHLYLGVGVTGGTGAVLRWQGNESTPFDFVVVGTMNSEAAELVVHEGRLFASTWPTGGLETMSLYMSPPIPDEGGLPQSNGLWTKIWEVKEDYEPDGLVASTYGGGAMASYDGYLYFGTMHVPFLAALRWVAEYGTPPDIGELLMGTHRSISIFRGFNFHNPEPSFELVYGMSNLPVYTPPDGSNPGFWGMADNLAGMSPIHGPSGFGNIFNNYTWSMAVFDGQLWVGTMDWSYLAAEGMNLFAQMLGVENPFSVSVLPGYPSILGADLYYFPSSSSPAFPESIGGVGNSSNYGIRNMIADADALYIGTANPMNLLTDPSDQKPQGGWELLKLTKRLPNTPAGSDVQVSLPNGIQVAFCEVVEAGHTLATTFPNIFTVPVPGQPEGYGPPVSFYLLATTARIAESCPDGSLGSVCIPYSVGVARLYELQYEGGLGFSWEDITTSATSDTICGTLTDRFMGILAIMAVVPTITSVTPQVLNVGQEVTITGSGFSAGNVRVCFNGVEASQVTVIDDNTLVVIFPSGVPLGHPLRVTVTTAGGRAQYAGPPLRQEVPIPTLSEWGMIALFFLLMLVAVISLQRQRFTPAG